MSVATTLRKVTPKTASYTIKLNQPDRSGLGYTNRGAAGAVTFTLPTPNPAIAGVWYFFDVQADQSLIVSCTGKLVTSGNALADNVSFEVTGAKIGGRIIAVCDGISWLAHGSRSGGGFCVNGVPFGQQELTKETTAIVDATATAVLTVTVPNVAQAAMLEISVIGRLGAGGAIGADEAVQTSKYQASIVRTVGVASVCTLSAQLGAVAVAVAGAATVTATLTAVANAEGVGVANTHTLKVTITKSGGASAAHKCNLSVRLLNAPGATVTIA